MLYLHQSRHESPKIVSVCHQPDMQANSGDKWLCAAQNLLGSHRTLHATGSEQPAHTQIAVIKQIISL